MLEEGLRAATSSRPRRRRRAGDADRRHRARSARTAPRWRGCAPRRWPAAEGRVARCAPATPYYGYGQYAEAAELYRAALQKGGEDAGLVNVRLGAALALAGQRAEAEAAFRAVTGGDRAELAQLWLLWLSSTRA